MFEIKQITKFYEADPAGVVFFGNTFKMIHNALEEFLRFKGVYDLYFLNSGYAFPVKTTSADFKKPLLPGKEVIIALHIVRIQESSFEIEYEIKNSDGITAASANTVHVCVDKKTGKKSKLPTEISEILNNI